MSRGEEDRVIKIPRNPYENPPRNGMGHQNPLNRQGKPGEGGMKFLRGFGPGGHQVEKASRRVRREV
jgi:hypothetical protein